MSVTAINISLSAPKDVQIDNPFEVSLSLDSSDTYDIKITIQSGTLKNLSKIKIAEDWKSTYYYVEGAYPQQTSFTLKAVQYAENTTLCAQARKTGTKTSQPTTCIPIVLHVPISVQQPLEAPSSSSSSHSSQPSTPKNKTATKDVENQTFPVTEISSTALAPASIIPTVQHEQVAPIDLRAPKTYTFNGKKIALISSFSLICLIVLLLMLFRKI